MDLCEYEVIELVNVVMDYAQDHENFDTSFTESLRDDFDEYGEITYTQRLSLENVVKKFKMIR